MRIIIKIKNGKCIVIVVCMPKGRRAYLVRPIKQTEFNDMAVTNA